MDVWPFRFLGDFCPAPMPRTQRELAPRPRPIPLRPMVEMKFFWELMSASARVAGRACLLYGGRRPPGAGRRPPSDLAVAFQAKNTRLGEGPGQLPCFLRRFRWPGLHTRGRIFTRAKVAGVKIRLLGAPNIPEPAFQTSPLPKLRPRNCLWAARTRRSAPLCSCTCLSGNLRSAANLSGTGALPRRSISLPP